MASTTNPKKLPRQILLLLVPLWLASLSCGGGNAQATKPWPTSPSITLTAPIALPPTWTPMVAPSERPSELPGWKVISTGRIEVTVPEGFTPWDPVMDRQTLLGLMRYAGGEQSRIAQLWERDPSSLVLWAWAPESDASGIAADITVLRVLSPETESLEAFMAKDAQALPSYIQSMERQVSAIGERNTGRMIEDTLDPQGLTTARSVVYVLQESSVFWEVICGSHLTEHDQWLPIFEQSFSLVTLLP